MLNGSVHLMVEDIESLLKDICEFLSKNVNDGFSDKQKLIAERLINRSKSQLQTITKFTETLAEADTSYVDMTPKVSSSGKEDIKEIYQEEYSAVDEQQISRHCPYTSKSASELKENTQWGYLERKKSLWFLGHQIRQFGIVVDGWLLLFNSEKDNKPIDFLDLEMFVVKYCDSKDSKCKKDARSFELISAAKSYQFIAKNSKDLDQWVTSISKIAKTLPDENTIEENVEFKLPKKPKILIKELPPLPQSPSVPNPYILRPSSDDSNEPLDTYDAVSSPLDEENYEKEENIYECPVLINKPSNAVLLQKTKELPPPLPPPPNTKSFLHSKQNVPLATPINENEEDEEVEYDLPLIEKKPSMSNNSISPDFSSAIAHKQHSQTLNDEPEEAYDEVVAPPTTKPHMKPNIQFLTNKFNSKQSPPRIYPKPKVAGINRGGSFTKR